MQESGMVSKEIFEAYLGVIQEFNADSYLSRLGPGYLLHDMRSKPPQFAIMKTVNWVNGKDSRQWPLHMHELRTYFVIFNVFENF